MNRSTLILLLLVVASSLLVVTIRHENRLAFVTLQEQENLRNRLQNEWGRLMLERATWSDRTNIADDAGERLGMVPPAPEKIVTVELDGDR